MSKKILSLAILIGAIAIAYYITYPDFFKKDVVYEEAPVHFKPDTVEIVEAKEPEVLYGIVVDSMLVIDDVIKPNQNLSEILSQYNVPYPVIHQLAQKSKDVFDVRRINANRKYTIICSPDSLLTAQCFIYEPSATEYVVFNLQDSIHIYKGEHEVTVSEKTITGEISTSLSDAMVGQGASPLLVNTLADIYSWEIDFFRLQRGDKFKMIYEEKRVGDEFVGYGRVLGAYFEHFGEAYYAIPFDQGEGTDYFDEEGKSLRKAFLRDPLEYTRISSRYSPKRYHPVLKQWRSHLGTDYAAPTGTPIRSVGDGLVVEAGYTSGNGNYIKIRHNGTYTTQYLHMSRFAKGVKKGVRVKQGQTIGYVGSTGLATGPHLCYRFWKNGVQVDALRVELPPSKPIHEEHEEAYAEVRDQVINRLDNIDFPEKEYIASSEDQPTMAHTSSSNAVRMAP